MSESEQPASHGRAVRRVSARANRDHVEGWKEEAHKTLEPSNVQRLARNFGHFFVQFDRNVLNWSKLRSFGELQVLTRASYLMLLIVPFAASLWSPFISAVHRYEEKLVEVRAAADTANQKLQHTLTELINERAKRSSSTDQTDIEEAVFIQSTVTNINSWLSSFKVDHPVKENHGLPLILTLSFIASLLVLAGQLTYQVTVPDKIRESSLLSFISQKTENWKEINSLGLRNEAIEKIGAALELNIESQWIRDAAIRIPKLNPSKMTRDDDELVVFQGAAAAEYALEGVPNPIARAWVGGCYSIAVGIILYVLVDRSFKIFTATDWPW